MEIKPRLDNTRQRAKELWKDFAREIMLPPNMDREDRATIREGFYAAAAAMLDLGVAPRDVARVVAAARIFSMRPQTVN